MKPVSWPLKTTKTMNTELLSFKPALDEIAILHGEITAAASTSLEKAMRVGELLAGIKAVWAMGNGCPGLRRTCHSRTARPGITFECLRTAHDQGPLFRGNYCQLEELSGELEPGFVESGR